MYNISSYGKMIADRVRTTRYIESMQRTIVPGSIVVDLGAGTGIFALVAVQLGARHVYAIEISDAIQIGMEAAIANRYQDYIEFIQAPSATVNISERAQVIVSDLRGVLPLYQDHILTIIDARRRLLGPGGVLIPKCDVIKIAPVEAPELYLNMVEPWEKNGYNLDLRSGRNLVMNTWRKARVSPGQLLADPKCWATLDYMSIECPDIQSTINFSVSRSGTGYGLIIWFDTVLVEGVGFSNGPDAPELIYGSAFFPWLQPVDLAENDHIAVHLAADFVRDDYVWCWNTKVYSGFDSTTIKAEFKQSTFFGMPWVPSDLRKKSATHVPTLNIDGEIERFTLTRMDGQTALDDIARQLTTRFPDRFASWIEALSFVSEASTKFSQ
jgi:protein arginine N-methyltransferase 1